MATRDNKATHTAKQQTTTTSYAQQPQVDRPRISAFDPHFRPTSPEHRISSQKGIRHVPFQIYD
jgi:hypothetical protein